MAREYFIINKESIGVDHNGKEHFKHALISGPHDTWDEADGARRSDNDFVVCSTYPRNIWDAPKYPFPVGSMED